MVDAYKRLKLTPKRELDDDSEVVEAVEKVEQKPGYQERRKGMRQEELEEARVGQDSRCAGWPRSCSNSSRFSPVGRSTFRMSRAS